jgi:hypothetical protein
MSLDAIHRLHELQTQFESEPTNTRHAYYYFSELNKHGKYNTVVRLYDKHQL